MRKSGKPEAPIGTSFGRAPSPSTNASFPSFSGNSSNEAEAFAMEELARRDLEGCVVKRGNEGKIKAWQKRYFVLGNTIMN